MKIYELYRELRLERVQFTHLAVASAVRRIHHLTKDPVAQTGGVHRALGCRRQTASDLVKRAIKAGVVAPVHPSLIRTGDQRIRGIVLTEAGRRILADLEAVH